MTHIKSRPSFILTIVALLLGLTTWTSDAQAATLHSWNQSSGLCATAVYVELTFQNVGARVFAAVNSENTSCRGVYRSTNGGASFTKVGITNPGFSAPRIYDISSTDNGKIYVATDQGIWYTEDSNLITWHQLTGGIPLFNEIERLSVISKTGDAYDDLYATVAMSAPGPNSGVWRSADSGASWTKVLPNVYASRVTRGRGCPSGADSTVVMAARPDLGGLPGGLWISTDNGLNWAVSSSWPTARANDAAFDCYNNVITPNPNYGHLFVTNADPAASTQVYRSTDLGQTFQADFNGPVYSCCASNIKESNDPTAYHGPGYTTAEVGTLRWRAIHPAQGETWQVFPGTGWPANTSMKSWTRFYGPPDQYGQYVAVGNNKVFYYLP